MILIWSSLLLLSSLSPCSSLNVSKVDVDEGDLTSVYWHHKVIRY